MQASGCVNNQDVCRGLSLPEVHQTALQPDPCLVSVRLSALRHALPISRADRKRLLKSIRRTNQDIVPFGSDSLCKFSDSRCFSYSINAYDHQNIWPYGRIYSGFTDYAFSSAVLSIRSSSFLITDFRACKSSRESRETSLRTASRICIVVRTPISVEISIASSSSSNSSSIFRLLQKENRDGNLLYSWFLQWHWKTGRRCRGPPRVRVL